METLAKKYGFVIEMRDTLADGMANGYYDPKSDRIYIALDAKDGGYLHAGGHELYHYIERWSPEAATKLRAFVINRLKNSNDYDYEGRVKELEKLYEGYGQEDIDSEIVAECMFDVFDEQTIKELVGENRSLAVKIQSWIQGFIESINEILKNLGLTSPEIKALEGDEEALETISDLFKSALEQTRENKASGKADVTESENTVKYSIVNLDNGMSYVKASRKIIEGNDKATWRKQITAFFNRALSVEREIPIDTIEGDTLYITSKTRDKARSDSVTENGRTRPLTDVEFRTKLEAESHIDELAEVSKVNNKGKITPDSKNHPFAKDGFTYRTAYFEDADGQYYKITLSVGHNGTVSTIYNVGKIKKDSMPNGKVISMIGSKADILSTHSISPKTENVNKKFSLKDTTNESDSQTKSEAFKEWFGDWENEPESASKVVNEDGTPKVVYHGTGNEFFCFRQKKQGENYRQGKGGFFFTSHKRTAENYAKLATDDGGTARVVEAYLSIKKPYTVYANAIYIIL